MRGASSRGAAGARHRTAGLVSPIRGGHLRSKDPLAEPRLISGVFTLAETGTLAEIVVPPKMGSKRFDLRAIGDVDRDGFDDLELAITGGGSDEHRIIDWHDRPADGEEG